MSLDKAIKHGKEHRKEYYRSEAFDATCRPGGGCPFCERGRKHADRKSKLSANEQIKELVIMRREKDIGAGSFQTCPNDPT